MIHFKNENGEVFGYESEEDRAKFGGPGLVLMTAAEFAAHIELSQPSRTEIRKAEVLAELAAVDAASARPLRAILVGSATDEDRARLVELDEQAAVLRAELATLEPPPAA